MKKYHKIIFCLSVVFIMLFWADSANAGVFETLGAKAKDFAARLRVIAYVISCFGIVMFSFLAICGKINFKHLGYIFISLVILSSMGATIDYFSDAKGQSLKSEWNEKQLSAPSGGSTSFGQ